jgi:hypothetical protein
VITIFFFIGLVLPLIGILPYDQESNKIESFSDELKTFQHWAQLHNVSLVGLEKNSDKLFESGYESNRDVVPIYFDSITLKSLEIFYEMPETVLSSVTDKTLFFSSDYGRGYAQISTNDQLEFINGMSDGIILEGKITKKMIVHELGHMLDEYLIHNSKIKLEKNKLFKIDFSYNNSNSLFNGFISPYSNANSYENFAEHFSHYVLDGEKFRELIKNDYILKQKYDFFKELIFDGTEFS